MYDSGTLESNGGLILAGPCFELEWQAVLEFREGSMQEEVKVSLGNQAEVTSKVQELWEKVFKNSNEVLTQHLRFGFDGVKNGDPNIEQRLLQLQALEAIFDLILNNRLIGELDYEQQRQILNAKQQITNMEMVAAAVKADKVADYEEAVKSLEKQLPI